MAEQRALRDFPALATWYDQTNRSPQEDRTLPGWLAFKTCAALDSPGDTETLKRWVFTLRESFTSSQDLRRDYLTISSHFNELDADFSQILGDLCHLIVRVGIGDLLFPVLQIGAARTNLAALRFLAAWTALNCNRPDLCVEECEQVDQPYSPLHALQGQAYLELGKPQDALDALHVATTLSPEEILPWFQKAKALHVLGLTQQAFEALIICERLAPDSNEVALFMAMIAGDLTENISFKEHAWTSLRPHLNAWGHVPHVPLALLGLAGHLDDKNRAFEVINALPTALHLTQGQDLKEFSGVLRLLQRRGWMDVAAALLQKTTSVQS